MHSYLDFENAIADLDAKIRELRTIDERGEAGGDDVEEAIRKLEKRVADTLRQLYSSLTPWQKAQVARHEDRPHCVHYVDALFTDFTPLAGDRTFAEDHAVITGFARFRGNPVAVIGQEKGSDTKTRLKHNFGMARPEGYRKAVRIMEMANRFGIPVVSLVDTTGAYPGVGAEERGQAEAIARSTEACLALNVPNVSVVIGEGGSGGAIAIAVANRVYMLEHAIYSVISPEGAASILWHDSSRARDAATNMKITAQDLLSLKIIDGIIAEPVGGAHRNAAEAIAKTGETIETALADLAKSNADHRAHRREKFLAMGRSL